FGLRPGVVCFLVTTARGGTGSGASTPVGAVIRSVLPNGKIHLRCIMPCVFGGDDRAKANAFAVMVENQHHHRYHGYFPMRGGKELVPPFDTASYIFVGNGRVTLSPVDALMQEVAVMSAYLRPRTQSAINSREADLTDVILHDFDDKPTHIRVTTAVSIRTIHPGVQDYLATEWVRQEVDQQQERFEGWCQDGRLNADEDMQLQQFVEQAKKDLNLTLPALLNRLDQGVPANTLLSFFEQFRATIAAMRARPIKETMKGLPNRVKDLFANFERTWESQAAKLAVSIPREIEDYIATRLAAAPHLAAEAESRLLQFLVTIAADSVKAAERDKAKRDAAGKKLGQSLGHVDDAGPIARLFRWDEVTRNAAFEALNHAFSAASARTRQQEHEYLNRSLEGEISLLDGRGKQTTVRGAILILRDNQVEQLAATRRHHATMIESLNRRLEILALGIEKRSQVFQRSIMYDGLKRSMLDRLVTEVRSHVPDAPPIANLRQGKQSLEQTLAELQPLLPLYAQSTRSLTQLLTEDSSKLDVVVKLLKNSTPFTQTDHVVEDQQGLSAKSRRDKLVILEVPGGREGNLGSELLRRAVVEDANSLVDSLDDEIRLFHLRDGLPYGAIMAVNQYKERHDEYLKKPGAITPYSVASAHGYMSIEASQVNLRTYTEALLYKARTVLPNRVLQQPSGHWILYYEVERAKGFKTTDHIRLEGFDKLVVWLEKQVEVRKALNESLNDALNENPEQYKLTLFYAWQNAEPREREYLQEELFNLRVDPAKLDAGRPESRASWTAD
ncbi:MAG: hypothetical protein DMF61_26225, partial [Blastocatellia bacterium AA13]